MDKAFSEEQVSFLKGLIQSAVEQTPKGDATQISAPDDGLQVKVEGMEASLKSVMELLEKLPGLDAAGYKTDIGGDADPNHKSLGDFLLAVKRGDVKRIRGVYKTFRSEEVWTDDEARKDMSGEDGTAGGYLIPSQFMPQLLQAVGYASVIRPRATVIPADSPSGFIPALDQYTAPTAGIGNTAFAGGVVVTWAGEGSAGSETQPSFDMLEWKAKKMAAYTEVPNEVGVDSAIGIEALLTALFGRAVGNMEEYAFIRGNGVGKPLGFLAASAAIGVTTATDNVFAYADALSMRSRFRSLMGDPIWLIHPGMWPDIGIFEVGTGGAVWQANVAGPLPQTLLGYPIFESEHMPAPNTDDVALLDPKAYLIVDRGGMAVAYSEHAAFTTDKGTWRVTKRLDGMPWVKNAITLADPGGAYTVSPFVYHND